MADILLVLLLNRLSTLKLQPIRIYSISEVSRILVYELTYYFTSFFAAYHKAHHTNPSLPQRNWQKKKYICRSQVPQLASVPYLTTQLPGVHQQAVPVPEYSEASGHVGRAVSQPTSIHSCNGIPHTWSGQAQLYTEIDERGVDIIAVNYRPLLMQTENKIRNSTSYVNFITSMGFRYVSFWGGVLT